MVGTVIVAEEIALNKIVLLSSSKWYRKGRQMWKTSLQWRQEQSQEDRLGDSSNCLGKK